MTFRFKVCGLTESRGLEAVLAAGADAVGFNFHPGSARYIAPERARALVRRLPGQVAAVGVFVNLPLDEVVRLMDVSGVTWAQFHGDDRPAGLARFPRPWYPALRPREAIPADLADWDAPFVLVDAHQEGHFGGTGRAADWRIARRIARMRPTILAGGLCPDNLAEALARVRPAGVDLNSGVEQSPGIKDPALVSRAGAILAEWHGKGEQTG